MRLAHLAGLLALILCASPTLAQEPILLHAGDRANGTLAGVGDEAGFAFDALVGTEVKITVKAAKGSALEPDFLLIDPDEVRLPMGSRYKHEAGSSKAKLSTFDLPMTGRYVLVVTGLADSIGAFTLKFKATHPRKFKDIGRVEFAFDSDLTRFAGFSGSALAFKVKGRSSFEPAVRSLLQPDTAEVNVTGVVASGKVVTGSTYFCPETGDYRLRIEMAGVFGGEWKSKIKLTHPTYSTTTHDVTGQPEGTFTADMKEPGTTPTLPIRAIVSTPEFRLTLSILNPTANRTWTSGETISLMVTLENTTAGDITVRFLRDPWHNVVVRNVQTSQIVWQLNPNPLVLSPFVTFPWAYSRSWSTLYDSKALGGAFLPPGEYDIVATFQTDDARIPQDAWIRVNIE